MRQIKFRGKSLRDGEWFYGNLFDHDTKGNTHITTLERGCLVIDPETVGQFTGLTDEFNREVYEGDIIMLDGSPEMGVRVVVFYEESFNIATRKEYDYLQQGAHPYLNDYAHMDCLNTWSNSGLVRVVGNIYDNPELLED
jgi:uncharacterized phage protein (TIGR01671 family)